MIISSEVILKELSIHQITETGLKASEQSLRITDEDLNALLVKYFFKFFKSEERFHFAGFSDLQHHAVCQLVSKIFDAPNMLHQQSLDLANHLITKSTHHNIKEGDFFAVYFEDCVLDDEVTDAIGLFKIENKETYIKIMDHSGIFGINQDEGISINKLDKGAIIFNSEAENGYQVLLVDKTNKSSNAQYWKDDFLAVEPIQNEYYQTQNLINDFQEFAQETFQQADNADKFSYINESIDYMKNNDEFDKEDYQETVLQSPELIERFEEFQEKKMEEEPERVKEQFDISKAAVKDTKRFIRSVIKLDKNFHVYVHGNRENIEKGFDPEKRKNYYTLYFDNET